MELEKEFTQLYREFRQEISILQQNSNYLDEFRTSIDGAKNSLKNDKSKWVLTYQSLQQFQNAMKQFNDVMEKIFDDFDKIGSDGNGCSIDMQQRLNGGKCQITHVIDSTECICYAMDLNGAIVSRLKTFWKEAPYLRLQRFDEDSNLSDVFGIEFNSKLNRAKFQFDSTMNTVRIRLIDTGEIIDVGQFNLQKLPDDIKTLPAAAFKCRINQIGNATVQSLPDSMKGQIFNYHIHANDENNDVYCIYICPTNPFSMGRTIDTNVKMLNIVNANYDPAARTNSDLDVVDIVDNFIDVNFEQTVNKRLQGKWIDFESSPEKLLNTNSICSSNYDLNDNTSNAVQSVKNRSDGPINGGLACDWDDDVNHDWDTVEGSSGGDGGGASGAASIAMVQQPTIRSDEKSISIKNRYDAATALESRYNRRMSNKNKTSAAKQQTWPNDRNRQSSNSIFHSVPLMKTQCETTVVQSNHSKLKVPRVGEQITILPTYVLNATQLYGQLGMHFNALEYSQQTLNYRRLYFENEPYSQMPGEGELVMILLQNGSFYRAKVLTAWSNHEILVFLVDYGTTHKIELRYIYKWTPNCDKFPFYAVVFTLGNVQYNTETMPRVFECVKAKVPKTFTSAEVIKIDDQSITVRIFDDSGYDIGEEINCMNNNDDSNGSQMPEK